MAFRSATGLTAACTPCRGGVYKRAAFGAGNVLRRPHSHAFVEEPLDMARQLEDVA